MVEMPMIAKGAEELYLAAGDVEPTWIGGGGDGHGKDRDAAGDGGGVELDWCAGVCGGCEGGSVGDIAGGEELAEVRCAG